MAGYILGSVALVFLVLGVVRAIRRESQIQARTWLLVGTVFAAVSGWLLLRS